MSAKRKKRQKQKASNQQGVYQRIQVWFKDRHPILMFLFGFIVCMVIFYAFYYSGLYRNHLEVPFLYGQASLSNALLSVFGQATTVTGSEISGDGFSVNIKNGCDGLEAIAILVSGILIFPVGVRKKIMGLAFGIPVLLVANIIRIVVLYLSGKYLSRAVFDVLHIQGGFVLFTLLSVLLWFVWMNWATRQPQNSIAE